MCMSSRIKAGINASRDQISYVFNSGARDKLDERLSIDWDLVPDKPDVENIRASLQGAEIIVSTWGALPYTQEILEVCPNLKLILHGAGSFKSYVTPVLIERDVTVCTAVHMNAKPVAEFTLGVILSSLKNMERHNMEIHKEGRAAWGKSRVDYDGGYYHTKIGLLGYGYITKILLGLLKHFEFEVFVADDFATAGEVRDLGAKKTDIDDIMGTCDVISIHHADVPRNWNIINRDTLSLMKPGSRLINTSRGRMINEPDLIEKLKEGQIAAYLDVTHPEPPAEDSPLYSLPNCILTPHVSGSIGAEVHRMGDYCVRELENWLEGKPLENRIDIESLEYRA